MMLWQKLRADVGQHKTRMALAVLSIAAGVFCVGTLFGMIDLQLAKMDAAHRQSQPSHINLLLRQDADSALLADIRALPDVAGVDILTPLSVRFKSTRDSEWRLATLIFRKPPAAQQFDKTTLSAGQWPDAGQIAIEHLSAQVTRLNIGDRVELATSEGTQTLPISAIVRHPFVKPPKFGGPVHFFADAALAARFGVAPRSFRQLLVGTTPPYAADKARAVAETLRAWLDARRISVNATLLQDPQQHWGRPFFAGVSSVLQVMAWAALVLAAVLIVNTVSAHIAEQSQQIGVMKALGARTATIARFYCLEIILMASAALLLAVPAALAAAYISSCQLLALFNIGCDGFACSWRALAVMVAGGLLVPLLAASIPIARGAAITVREAMANYGIAADFGGNALDLWVERLGVCCLPTLYATALGNLFRRKIRLLLTQTVLVLAGLMFLVLMALVASVNLTLNNELARSRYAVRLSFSQDQPAQTVTALASAVVGTNNVELWQRLPMALSKNGRALRQKGSLGAQLLALPPDTVMYQPLIEAGRWLQAADNGQNVLVLSADTAALNGINVGDDVAMRLGSRQQDTWRVIGLYRWLAGGNYAVEPVYAPLASVQAISHRYDSASFALLAASVTNLAEEAAYLRQLKQVFQESGIVLDVYGTLATLEQRQFARNQFTPVLATLQGLAAMIATVGGMGLAGTLTIGVLQRRREIGVLRAIGAPSAAIFRLFLLEGLWHGGMAWAVSIPLAYLAAEPIATQLGETMLGIRLDFAFDYAAVGYWWLIMLMLAWLASYWPARQAARLTVKACLDR